MMDLFLNPPLPNTETIKTFYQVVIDVTAILFPVFQAVLFFIIEKSFDKFTIMKQDLIKHYRKQGRIISLMLFYCIVASIFGLLGVQRIMLFTFSIYVCFLLILRLDLFCYTGYRNTLFSTKSNPEKLKVFKAIRYWINNNFFNSVWFLFFLIINIIYPAYLSFYKTGFQYSDNFAFFSILSALFFSLLSIVLMVNYPLKIQGEILKQENFEDKKLEMSVIDSENENIKNQYQVLLKQNIIFNSNYSYKSKNVSFNLANSYFVQEDAVLFNNISLREINLHGIEYLKNWINEVTVEYFLKIITIKTDINTFVLSYHIYFNSGHRNISFRMSRAEIERLQPINDQNKFIDQIKNKLYDDILK
jgi:hypothetical protein